MTKIQKPSEQVYRSGERLQSRPEKSALPAIERYYAALDAGEPFVPATPRFASTVMLVRENPQLAQSPFHSTKPLDERVAPPNGLEVFMMRRQKSMSFVPDAMVFPGGQVDEKDADPALPWTGPSPAQWASYVNQPEAIARQIIVAAIREVFEESGVLLAGEDEASVLADVTGPEWLEERKALVEHQQSFAEMLIRRNLILRTDLLNFKSNWITPIFSPQRYNTFFFCARCPEGQTADDRSREASMAGWFEPQWVYDKADEHELILVPPTIYNLGFVARARSLDDLMGHRRDVKPIMQEAVRLDDGSFVITSILP